MQLGETKEVKCTRKPHVDTAYEALARCPEAWQDDVSPEAVEFFNSYDGVIVAGSQCLKWAWKDGDSVVSCYADYLLFEICCQFNIWDEE